MSRALRLTPPTSLAFVGAGGKTTAIFQLARQLSCPVFITTTTHLGSEQPAWADLHLVGGSLAELKANLAQDLPRVVAVTGALVHARKWSSPGAAVLAHLIELTQERRGALLIEADGSRRLPLKAPADHEPVIPDFVEQVVVLAGLSGLGEKLDGEHVHRPEQFAALSGLLLGEPVSRFALAKVLLHEQGGQKNIPAGARRVVLLNQADTAELKSAAYALASELLPAYDAVLIAALEPTSGTTPQVTDALGRPVQQAAGVFAVHEPVAGVILAAGASQRLGSPKPLLEWQGESFVHRAARTAMQAGLAPVVIVAGETADLVSQAVSDLPVKVLVNPIWQSGQSSSIHLGVKALPASTGAAIFLLVDQPQIPAALLRALVEEHAAGLPPVLAPLAGGQRANPVLFDRVTFPDLLEISGDQGGRAIFSKHPVSYLPWHDERILLDVDTPVDYQRLLRLDEP